MTDTSPVFIKPYPVFKNEDYFISFSHGTTSERGIEYPLFVGAEYVVYGIMVHDNTMYYLISFEESNVPDWIPSDLFEITDPTIPYFWIIQTTFSKNDNIMFILSHHEIATNFSHMLGLLQGISSDFNRFRKSMLEY
ncbi:hypothetical protein EOM60_05925 [Candidatus Saccharibacteria bacterium]|nr:hypothetical protein [Candidatus Saccharibacteria bacterium]